MTPNTSPFYMSRLFVTDKSEERNSGIIVYEGDFISDKGYEHQNNVKAKNRKRVFVRFIDSINSIFIMFKT